MLHTIKAQPSDFNLLYLSDGEHLINTIKCYFLDPNTRSMEEGKMHLNTRSVIIQPKDISKSIIQLKYSEAPDIKAYTVEEILLFCSKYFLETTSSRDTKPTYFQKSSAYKKFSSFFGNFLQNSQGVAFNNIVNNYHQHDKYDNTTTNNLNNPLIKNPPLSSRKSGNLNNSIKNSNNKVNKSIEINTGSSGGMPMVQGIINSNHIINNSTSHFLNYKLTNFGEVVNKAIKEGTTASSNNLILQTNLAGKSLSLLNNPNIHITHTLSGSSHTGSSGGGHVFSEMNFVKQANKPPGIIRNYVYDLAHFFQENGLNFQNFYEFLKYLKEYFLLDGGLDIKYNFLLITANKSISINREPVTIYETCIQPTNFFIIIEGEQSKILSFHEDRKYIIENIQKNIYDDSKELSTLLAKKISEMNESIEKMSGKEPQISIPEGNVMQRQSFGSCCYGNIMKWKAMRILPEGVQHGLFAVYSKSSANYAEFRAVTNNYKGKSLKISLTRIEALVEYRYLYKMRGIHIFLYQSRRSKILIFDTEKEAVEVIEFLRANSPNLDRTFNNIEYHTELWTRGLLSNYDYLIYLNIMSSRSFSDLSQYPVFPWVITNYEDEDDLDISEAKNFRDFSKAIGALNSEKLARFTEKYLNDKTNYSTNESPYLYPFHYSSPLIIIFYLNRAFPRFQLQMQSGSFDCRMLVSIKEFWEYLYLEGNEVTELIPEFYSADGDFLLNIHNIHYGKAKNGQLMNDVILPKWAKSPKDFIRINRSALESEFVSNNLNNWIDLIFGSKQRGGEAEMHENLFRPSTYDDYNYDDFNDMKKSAEITNILQSGQTPRHLFTQPHPKKRAMDVLNYELQTNPKEMTGTLEKYKRENELLENSLKQQSHLRYQENEKIIAEHKETEKQRGEQITKLKESLLEREKQYKSLIEKMIDQNSQLKSNFEAYDANKEKFISEMIANLEESNKKEIENKFSSDTKVCNYIKSLEMQINTYKIKEKDYQEIIETQVSQLEKSEKANEKLKEAIEKLNMKISLANDTMKNNPH